MKLTYITRMPANTPLDVRWDSVIHPSEYVNDPDTMYFCGARVDADFVELCREQVDGPGVYALSGIWLALAPDGKLGSVVRCVQFNRNKGVQRYMRLDSGVVDVHLLNTPNLCLFQVPEADFSDILDAPAKLSSVLESMGVRRRVIDSSFWNGPRLPMNRYTGFSSNDGKYTDFRGSMWKPIPLKPDPKPSAISDRTEPKPLERREYHLDPGKPVPLTVMVTTHDRTDTCIATIGSLVQHLKYPDIRWVLCDDRSGPGHVAKVMDEFAKLGVEDVRICRTNDTAWGLGASMNNGLRMAFDTSPVVLTTEDDWMLERDLDVSEWVDFLMDHEEAAMVRMGMGFFRRHNVRLAPDSHGLSVLMPPKTGQTVWVVNNQVGLRHRRMYDAIGLYAENCHPDVSESNFNTRYRKATGNYLKPMLRVYWPDSFTTETQHAPGLPFYHYGKSTCGHRFDTGKYVEPPKPRSEMQVEPSGAARYLFHIVTPFHNDPDLLERCLKSVASQDIGDGKVRMTVVDDASDAPKSERARAACSRYDFVTFVRNDERSMAGGARNTALDMDPGSEYTVFLDSDDTFASGDALSKLEKELGDSGFPDMMVCGYVEAGGGHRMFNYSSPRQLAEGNGGIAPWTRVTRTSKVCRFVADRRMCNDVVQFLRQIDNVGTVAHSTFPLVKYHRDNPLSGWHGPSTRKGRDAIRAVCLVSADILAENFTTTYAAKRAIRELKEQTNTAKKIVGSMSDAEFPWGVK